MKSLFRLREVLPPYRLQVSLLLLVVLGATLASLAIPAILQRIIDVGLAQDRVLYLAISASVDTQTERAIQQALAHLLHGRTAFVIAHRLSTVVNADRIVVIQDGRLVEEGSHEGLLAVRGIYYSLYIIGFES
jgi:ABC-type multidrug transport system fused ATPase/permease subunit